MSIFSVPDTQLWLYVLTYLILTKKKTQKTCNGASVVILFYSDKETEAHTH